MPDKVPICEHFRAFSVGLDLVVESGRVARNARSHLIHGTSQRWPQAYQRCCCICSDGSPVVTECWDKGLDSRVEQTASNEYSEAAPL